MIIKNKKLNIGKLISFGFSPSNNGYVYKEDIVNGQLFAKVLVYKDGTADIKIYDHFDNQEYVLHLVESVGGSFVGQVRSEYHNLLNRILNSCFDDFIFKTIQANEVMKHIEKTYGIKPEFPWNDENSVVRRRDNNKWFAAFLKVHASKLGIKSDNIIEVVNLKMRPEDVQKLTDGKRYFPAYHMNKKHWITIPFGNYLPTDKIIKMVDNSYNLTR